MSNFPRAFNLVGGPVGATQFVLTVCFARIYFHCHYVGDTIAGVLIGVLTSVLIIKFGLKDLLINVFFNIFGSSGSDDIYSDDL